MSLKTISEKDGLYFLTTTVFNWIDIFTRPIYRHIIIESLIYCQKNKGLKLYAWVIMSNHLHWVACADINHNLADIIRDFKKHTSKKIIEAIKTENESRKDWMLHQFGYAGKNSLIKHDFKLWQTGNDPILIYSDFFLKQKINYIHNNPVKAEIVDIPENYLFSSAPNYAGMKGLIDIELAW